MRALNAENAYRLGATYFCLLGVINFGATFLNSEVKNFDFLLLALGCLPLLINKRLFHLLFGSFGCFVSIIIGLAGLNFNLNPKVVHTSQFEFFIGYLLAASMLAASIMLMYAAANRTEDKKISLA